MTLTPNHQRYVCGFLFSPGGGHVTLVRKARPVWQAGRYNGVGGKVEPGEAPHAAMVREFREEATLQVGHWRHVATLSGRDYTVYFYSATHPSPHAAQAGTDEPVVTMPVENALNDPCLIPNLRWVIPLCLDATGLALPVQVYDQTYAASPLTQPLPAPAPAPTHTPRPRSHPSGHPLD